MDYYLAKRIGTYVHDETDAQTVHSEVLALVKKKEPVRIRFMSVEVCTPPFMDIAFGGLIRDLSPEDFADYISFEIRDPLMEHLVKTSLAKARLVYKKKKVRKKRATKVKKKTKTKKPSG